MCPPDQPLPAQRSKNVPTPVNQEPGSFVNDGREPGRTTTSSGAWPGGEALVDAHYGRLRRLCELLLGDRQEAEEVVQDVFMKACEAGARSETPNDWAAWLTRVTVNACRDRRRAGWWMRFRRWSDANTPDQQTQVRSILSTYRASSRPIVQQLRQAQSGLADKLLASGQLQAADLQSQLQQISQLRTQLLQLSAQATLDIRNLL